MKPKMKRILKLIAVLPFIALLSSCDSKIDSGSAENGRVVVKITQTKKMDLTEYITLNASTVFLKKEIVRATFQGFIEKIHKNIGDKIASGDLLIEIKTKESVADDNLNIPVGKKTFIGLIQIKAKSNGVLTELNYNAGDYVTEGEQIAVIANPSSLSINLNVPYQLTDKINIGTFCDVILPNGKTAKASIHNIIPRVDLTSQTQIYTLLMTKLENLPENLNVNVRIPKKTVKNATTLPNTAILNNETLDQFWIMKLLNDTLAVRVDVVKGIENEHYTQIVKPELNKNERIILDGAFGLPDTIKVSIGQ